MTSMIENQIHSERAMQTLDSNDEEMDE